MPFRMLSEFRLTSSSAEETDLIKTMEFSRDQTEPIMIIGDPPMALDERGQLKSRIATLFVRRRVLVTLPGIHAWQRLALIDYLNQQRAQERREPLSTSQEMFECENSVDLIIEPKAILIRPDPDNMPLAFEADELLQELVSKNQIKFLHVLNDKVRQAIKVRGEYWRISILPQSQAQMKEMILQSRISIAESPIYFYNKMTGTRYLTFHQFAQLEALPDDPLRRHLIEIGQFSGRVNRMNNPEVDFFMADDSLFGHADFAACNFEVPDPQELRVQFRALKGKFQKATPPSMRLDSPEDPEWRKQMVHHLVGQKNETVSEEIMRGLSPEFFLQVEWLPGGRFEDGELLFDTIFDEEDPVLSPGQTNLADPKIKGFIFNFLREFGDIEYVNVGRVASSLSKRPKMPGHRDVYIAEIKVRNIDNPLVRIIRMQKWGIREHLEENKDLLTSIMESEDYTEYILDRRLGCRQLGMNLTNRFSLWKINDKYDGSRKEYEGVIIWSTYFERDYVHGVASDKVAAAKFENPAYAKSFAHLLGHAAAPNIIVGRVNSEQQAVFDDGDEVLVEDEAGMPKEIIVSDHTGAFLDFLNPLIKSARNYALPIHRRLPWVPNPQEFAAAYVHAFISNFTRIQNEYRKRRRSFGTLFRHCRRDEHGSFAYRWEKILERLDQTNAAELGDQIHQHILTWRDPPPPHSPNSNSNPSRS